MTIIPVKRAGTLSASEVHISGFTGPRNEFGDEHERGSALDGFDPATRRLTKHMEQFEDRRIVSDSSFTTWPLDAVIDYTADIHHQLARQNGVIIYDMAQKVAYLRGSVYPELSKLVAALFLFLHDLLNHIKRQEQILFPAIRELSRRNKDVQGADDLNLGLIHGSLESMMSAHGSIRAELKNLGDLTNSFTPPQDACDFHRKLFARIQEFTRDLKLHINFENDIVFPRAILLAEEWRRHHESSKSL